MKIERGNAIFTLKYFPRMRRTETAPQEGGDFEVVNVEYIGYCSKDDLLVWEEQAIAEAWDRLETM